jgi:hypothetical protein
MLKDLHLNWVILDRRDNPDASGKYLDYTISGQSLKSYLGMPNSSDVTPFGWFLNKEEQQKALKELRLQTKSELVDSRVELYICAACGDIGCGAVTAKVIDKGDRIVWSEFASQSDPDEISEVIEVEDLEFERMPILRLSLR